MRIGSNPIKEKNEKNILKNHRIIIVVYIPDSWGDYFADLDLVLDKCLESLVKTINFETTNITLVNNGCGDKAGIVINKYISFIDKYVVYNENKGKVYAVLNEVRAVFESFVTITDADILFYSGWEKRVFEVFKYFPNAGVVSPMPLPYLTFHFNRSVFGLNTLLGKIKFNKFVDDDDIDLYCLGTNLPKLYERPKNKFNWKEKQFILFNENFNVIIGAYHVVSTYRVEQFRNIYSFPHVKFKNSYESFFIDYLADNHGFYRLSTKKTYAYHMGNKLDKYSENYCFSDNEIVTKSDFFDIKNVENKFSFLIYFNKIIGRIFIKFLWNKK